MRPLLVAPAILLLATGPAVGGNVLLLIADDVGVDRIGAYAEHPDPGRTPTIDRLAAEGLLFRNAWANPVCSPTRAGILTGRYSFRTGIGTFIKNSSTFGLSVDELSLPELIGGSSAVAGKWHLGVPPQGPAHPLDSGFRYHAGSLNNIGFSYFLWEKHVNGVPHSESTYATTDTTDEAIAMIAALPEPWFLWVAYNAPHTPLHVPPNHLHTYQLDGFPEETPVVHMKAMTEAMDTEIGRLLGHVDLATTTVIFIGDNGTFSGATDAPFDPEHAKGTVYEGGLNVPFIVAGAGVSARGVESEALVHTTDLFATIAELAGVASAAEDSVSIVPYLADPTRPSIRDTVYAELFRPNGPGPYARHDRAIRDSRYKLIMRLEGRDELYDLDEDRFEQNDLLLGALTPAVIAAYLELRAQLP